MSDAGVAARRLALDALERIDKDGAYANLLLPQLLADSDLDERDRGFVTELVYGSTRMRRSLDHVIARHLMRDDVEPRVRAALRIGAYDPGSDERFLRGRRERRQRARAGDDEATGDPREHPARIGRAAPGACRRNAQARVGARERATGGAR